MLRARWVFYGLLVTGAVALSALVACSDQHSTSPDRAFMEPLDDVLRTVGDCPPQVPTEQCRAMTSQERLDVYWAIHDHTNWAIPVCAVIGNHMKDYALSLQDLRIWPNALYPQDWGRWLAVGGQTVRISFNDLMLAQGWASERAKTAIHEGYHSFYQNPDDDNANTFADMCINN